MRCQVMLKEQELLLGGKKKKLNKEALKVLGFTK
jgi:hypothetical protein